MRNAEPLPTASENEIVGVDPVQRVESVIDSPLPASMTGEYAATRSEGPPFVTEHAVEIVVETLNVLVLALAIAETEARKTTVAAHAERPRFA